MRHRPKRWKRLAGLGLALAVGLSVAAGALLGWAPPATAAEAGPIGVITHPDRRGVRVTRGLLRDLFTMRTRHWPDGAPVTVFVLDDRSNAHDRFCRELLGTYPYVLRSRWDRLVFTGAGFAPVTVHSRREMRERVAETPGAIGYLESAGLAGEEGGAVRVVPVQEPRP